MEPKLANCFWRGLKSLTTCTWTADNGPQFPNRPKVPKWAIWGSVAVPCFCMLSRVANVPCTNPIMIVALLQHRVWLDGAPFKEFSLWLCATTETPGAWGCAPCDFTVSRLPGKCAFASIQAFDIPSLEETQMYHHQNGFAFDNAWTASGFNYLGGGHYSIMFNKHSHGIVPGQRGKRTRRIVCKSGMMDALVQASVTPPAGTTPQFCACGRRRSVLYIFIFQLRTPHTHHLYSLFTFMLGWW